jgi:ABC-type antimicrobial peptide transport system permease subunit
MIIPLELSSDAVEIYFKWGQETRLYEEDIYVLNHTATGKHTIIFILFDSFYNEKTIVYTYYVGLEYVSMNLTFQVAVGMFTLPLANIAVAISSIYNNTYLYSNTTDEGYLGFDVFPGSFNVSFEYASVKHNLLLSTNEGLSQIIYLGSTEIILEIRDYFVDIPIKDQYCLIRDSYGNRIVTLKTNNIGRIYTVLNFGRYICYFKRTNDVISVPFNIYSPNQLVTIKIPSPKHTVVFDFRYDNGSSIYNLPVTFTTLTNGVILTSTGLYSSVSLWISYGIVNITVTMKNGKQISLRRIFEPGKERITIILPSVTEDQWLKIPFKPIAGFTFIVSLSLEYMDYYLRGSLLFTYTLAYAEVLLILIVVIVNMYSILQNVYKESRRETTIMRMIGSTKLNVIVTVFSRLGVIAAFASLIGYGLGTVILKLLARVNQTVFFGHTFSPSGGWGIFFLNLVLILFTAFISSIFIARKAAKEKKITYTKR